VHRCRPRRADLRRLAAVRFDACELAAAQIDPPPNFGTTVKRDFIRGMGKVANHFVILLEPDRAFDMGEMAELCESAQLAAG